MASLKTANRLLREALAAAAPAQSATDSATTDAQHVTPAITSEKWVRDAADPFEGMNLPDQVKEYLLKPSVTMKDGSTVSPKDFVDGLLADGYGNPEYFVAPKGSQVGFLSKPGSPKATLNAKQMFYADAAFMAKKRAQKKQEQAAPAPEQVPAEASRPADDGAAQWNALTPAGRRAAMKAAGVKLPDAVMWEHISDASKQKLRPVVSNMLEHATEPQTAPAGAPAEPAQAAQAAVPHFETYDDANDWIERRAKDLGMSRRAFSSNDEYKAIYPQIKALYQDQKAKTSEQRMAALRDAGLAVGDRVQTTVPGMFLDGTDYSGTIVLRGGEPWVKVDGKITVSKNGRLHEASTVRWDSRWKKQTDTDAEHRGAPSSCAGTGGPGRRDRGRVQRVGDHRDMTRFWSPYERT